MLQWAFLPFLLLLNLISSFLSSPTSSIALTAPWYMYVYECLCVCVYICMNIFMYIYVHINTHRQMHINIHVHMFMYIYTQVHTHTEGVGRKKEERDSLGWPLLLFLITIVFVSPVKWKIYQFSQIFHILFNPFVQNPKVQWYFFKPLCQEASAIVDDTT